MATRNILSRAVLGCVPALLSLALASCAVDPAFDPKSPSRGPGQFVGRDAPLNEVFSGGVSPTPAPNPAPNPDGLCDADCHAYCESLDLQNPVDVALCPSIWGVGKATRPIDEVEACRRLYADLAGYFPSLYEIERSCVGQDLGEVARRIIRTQDYVDVQRRLWADRLRYNDLVVNVERIFDADDVVQKTYRGLLRYDEMVHVMSAHPVLTRRYDSAGDRVEALFVTFFGRPPFENERADMAKLYTLWVNGYFDHPVLGVRVPDAYIEHRCVDEEGRVDPATQGACTSILWGYYPVILEPTFRAVGNRTLSENLTREEWELLQTPGRILTTFEATWEHAAAEVLRQYLGYDLTELRNTVQKPLVEYLFAHHGDVRALHYAVVTSQIYLQSSKCSDEECDPDAPTERLLFGPLKQADAEVWLDSIARFGGEKMGRCDFRITNPREWIESSPWGFDLVANSRWSVSPDGSIDRRYVDVAQTLGGCPDNQVSSRFTAVSILNTATQEAFVGSLCNPWMREGRGVPVDRLIPDGTSPSTQIDAAGAEAIVEFQTRLFFARPATADERATAATAQGACGAFCTYEQFARAACYALLSSSEMLFY